MFQNKLKFLFLLCLFAGPLFAISDYTDFLVVPTAELLGDKAFQVRGTIGHHQSVCYKQGEPSMCDKNPFVSSLRFGLFNSFEIGVQFGSTVSLDVKNRIIRAYGFIPAVALGARAFVQSQEAYFYSASKADRKEQTGEFYAVAEWGNELWKVLAGVSAFPNMDANSVAPFWGFEQGLGTEKLSVIYEGFFRHGSSHHNAGLSIKPLKSLQISAGASEFYRFFFNENGDFKFRSKNDGANNGYRAPGVYVSLAINGGFSSAIQSQKNEVDSLKKDIATQNAILTDLRLKVNKLEETFYGTNPNLHISEAYTGGYVQNIQNEFEAIVKAYFETDLDLDSLRSKEESFIEKGSVYKSFLLREAQNKDAKVNNRIVAIRIMSHFPDSQFIKSLGDITADSSSSETIAREAALALGVINTPEARNTLSAVVNKTSGTVRKTIIDIIGEL